LALNRIVDGSSPLFCLHAGFGTVFDYEPLARHLDGQCTVYGLQCRMLLDREWQDSSLAAMAGDYAQVVLRKQPEGPLRLLGWSLGGPLAVLVAAELIRLGREVSLLGLVDSYLPGLAAAGGDWRDDFHGFVAVTLGDAPAAALDPATLTQLNADALAVQIGQLREQGSTSEVYARIEAQDLAHTFVVAMRLKALGEALHSLPAVAAEARCWWGEGVGSRERASFEAALGQCQASAVVAAGHFELLQHPSVLADIRDSLAPTFSH